jgi:hypothetical protein
LTFDDPAFIEYAFQLQSKNREEITVERDLRAKAREQRRNILKSKTNTRPSLYTGNTLSTATEPVPKITVHSDCTVKNENEELAAV